MRGPTRYTAFLSTKGKYFLSYLSRPTENTEYSFTIEQQSWVPDGKGKPFSHVQKSKLLSWKNEHSSHLRYIIRSCYWWVLSNLSKNNLVGLLHKHENYIHEYLHALMNMYSPLPDQNSFSSRFIQNSCYQNNVSSFSNQDTRLRTGSLCGHSKCDLSMTYGESSSKIFANDLDDLA